MSSGNSWKRRWLMIQVVTLTSSGMGMGLFLIPVELANQIASPVAMIVASLVGLVSVYIGGAAWDDKS